MTFTESAPFHPLASSRWLPAAGRSASAARPVPRLDIAAADWDLLFRAALEALARVAVAAPEARGSGRPLPAPPGLAYRECLGALDQLRRSVPVAPRAPQDL